MKLNEPQSGIYRITNVKTGTIYIGESINVVGRLATHFQQLKKDTHINLAMQHDCDLHGLESFKYEMLESVELKKKDLRALEDKYIQMYLDNGYALYNGKNNGFLHVKNRRAKRKDDERAKKRVRRKDRKALRSQEKLFSDSENVQYQSSDNLEGDKSRSHAAVTNKSNGTEGDDTATATERPTSKSLDENRQSRKSHKDYLPALPPHRHRDDVDERPLEDWHLFCDGELWKDEYPYYCSGKGCGRCLHINIDDKEEMLYALSTYLSDETLKYIVLGLIFNRKI